MAKQYGAYKFLDQTDDRWILVRDLIKEAFGDSLRIIYKELEPSQRVNELKDVAASIGFKFAIPDDVIDSPGVVPPRGKLARLEDFSFEEIK